MKKDYKIDLLAFISAYNKRKLPEIKQEELLKYSHITEKKYFWRFADEVIKFQQITDIFKIFKMYDEYMSISKGYTERKAILKYGPIEGKNRWESYRKIQSDTNTLEYKKQKYGWTEEQFKTYNKSRAVTEETMFLKYGEIKGKEKFEEYCKKQKYAGCSLDYFKEKYGEKEGAEFYKNLNLKKRQTLDNMQEKYGEELGKQKYEEYLYKCQNPKFWSKQSQNLFKEICKFLTTQELEKTYYGEKNKEYFIYTKDRVYFYDFVISNLKFCIEYHGDHYHGNPKLYKPDQYLRGRGMNRVKAKRKWKEDEIKINMLKEQRDYDTIVVWENDFIENKDLVLERIKNEIEKRRFVIGI